MKKLILLATVALVACGRGQSSDPAAQRQAEATRTAMNAADRETGMPRIRYNPLRWQVGIGRGRPCPIVLNKGGALYTRFSNLRWKLWRKWPADTGGGA